MAEKISLNEALKQKSTVVRTFAEEDRKKGGRPRKEEKAKEAQKITIYLSDEDLEVLAKAGKNYGLSAGKYTKMIALKEAIKELRTLG